MKYKAEYLRTNAPNVYELERIKSERRELYFILIDVVDTYNVGSFFRLADAMGVKKMWLCGKTECPPNPRIEKSSVGTWQWVDWEYVEDAEQLLLTLADKNSEIKKVAVEQSPTSIPLHKVNFDLPMALLAGNETEGISEELLKLCDQIIELPMHGVNYSMNVLMSVGLVLGAMEDRFGQSVSQ